MLRPNGTRLEVWGDPVSHSRSPQLHSAAYRVLGLDWTYERRQVSEAAFAGEIAGLSPQWRGLSLTMPLKRAAFEASFWRDRRAELTGAVNTLVFVEDGPRGFNTDVGGLARALREEGVAAIDHARIVGAGATATSAVVALGELGATRIEVVARRVAAVAPLAELGAAIGVDVVGVSFDDAQHTRVPVTIATLPGDAPVADAAADALAAQGGLLMDAVYGHWPTALANAWARRGNPAASGLGMLLHQALLQVRIFVAGDADAPLPSEAAVLAAMRLAVVGD
ncbi:shikimate dehydrogenase [Microbacterium sp.]|uniref:shikimate dehydrogenase n=1 Tax=Microbacterium sp. TaxID=51671 RepID=UPI002E332027|nr:shikimate dehydrogenase [Microbacterium sp.]HEX5729312.1 shikimate dehydrogenase [Microbacterium sp.]